jgi:hypothetical protein
LRRSSRCEAQALGPPADDPAPDETKGRGDDDPDDGLAPADNGDIDGELVAARQELTRAIERIDERKAVAGTAGLAASSSDTIGTPGSSRVSPSTMMALAASSASLTGERSDFACHATFDRSTAMIADAARDATPVSSASISAPVRPSNALL